LEQLIHTQSGLTVLLGPQKCYEFREIGSVQAVAIIDTIGSVADFIVMDLPNLSSEANVKALQCCNSVGLVVEPDPICLLAGKVTKEFLFSCGVSNSQLRLVVVRRDTVDSYKLEEISTYLESDLIGVIYPAPEAFNHANITRVPVVVSNPDSLAAKSFGEIADKLSTYL
jgi:MinD-like ATPase involved in chromosome partitioning or flagellar assembly